MPLSRIDTYLIAKAPKNKNMNIPLKSFPEKVNTFNLQQFKDINNNTLSILPAAVAGQIAALKGLADEVAFFEKVQAEVIMPHYIFTIQKMQVWAIESWPK
ncbi:hypothetical protein L345_08191, partial [Ophiophagus hannah]